MGNAISYAANSTANKVIGWNLPNHTNTFNSENMDIGPKIFPSDGKIDTAKFASNRNKKRRECTSAWVSPLTQQENDGKDCKGFQLSQESLPGHVNLAPIFRLRGPHLQEFRLVINKRYCKNWKGLQGSQEESSWHKQLDHRCRHHGPHVSLHSGRRPFDHAQSEQNSGSCRRNWNKIFTSRHSLHKNVRL